MSSDQMLAITFITMTLILLVKMLLTKSPNSPFVDVEEHNNKIKEVFNHIDQYTDPLEQIIHGMEYIFGEDYLQPNEIPQTRMQESLASTLVICVLYDSSTGSKTE